VRESVSGAGRRVSRPGLVVNAKAIEPGGWKTRKSVPSNSHAMRTRYG
jgi:hypothetical protein